MPQVKIKIICTGFKEPKTALLASLPIDPKRASPKPTKKKADTDGAAPAVTAAASDASYAYQLPAKRRKTVGTLIARVAQTLESRLNTRIEKRKQSLLAQDNKRRRDVSSGEDANMSMVHTAGMWKYIQESGYFEEPVSDADLQERIDWIKAMKVRSVQDGVVGNSLSCTNPPQQQVKIDTSKGEGFYDRMLGLLVEEGDSSDSGESGESSDDSSSSTSSDSSMFDETQDMVDLSDLTVDERVEIILRMMKILPDMDISMDSPSNERVINGGSHATFVAEVKDDAQSVEKESSTIVSHGNQQDALLQNGGAVDDDIDDTISAMIDDLQRTNDMINARADFAHKIARRYLETPEGANRRRRHEALALARGAALLKRNRETKAKAGKPKSKQDDDFHLPW